MFYPRWHPHRAACRERAGVHALTRCRSIHWSGRTEVLESWNRL